jgi:hypothetical protein
MRQRLWRMARLEVPCAIGQLIALAVPEDTPHRDVSPSANPAGDNDFVLVLDTR